MYLLIGCIGASDQHIEKLTVMGEIHELESDIGEVESLFGVGEVNDRIHV